MRRILATLAVVVALLFSAGSSWADFDDGVAALNRGDYATAFRELLPYAEQGNAGAQNTLGVMYDKGVGVSQDHAEAVKWYRKAAEQGNAQAQHNLGVMYVLGRGVLANNVKAYMWWSLAKALGANRAADNLDTVKKHMTPAEIAEAQALATEWLENHNN